MKKILALVLILIVFGMFTACGSGDDTKDVESSKSDVSAQSEQTKPESVSSKTDSTPSETASVLSEENKVTEEYITVPDGFDYSKWQLKVNGKLYYGTEEDGPMGDSGCVEGRIVGTVGEGETPTDDGYSNFGSVGKGYTYDDNGSIQVFTPDGCWRYFKVR